MSNKPQEQMAASQLSRVVRRNMRIRGLNISRIKSKTAVDHGYYRFIENGKFTIREILLIHLCSYHYPYTVNQVFEFAYLLKHAYGIKLCKLKYWIETSEKYGYALNAGAIKELRIL